MEQVYFRFYGELNDFLPPDQQGQTIPVPLNGAAAVKHPIESLGVPHPEVDAILVNQKAVDFAYLLQASDQIEVYPINAKPAVAFSLHLRPPLAGPIRFVLDTHLGQLATYLRLLGFDTLYRNDYADAELARISSEETRLLLTRDRGLLKRKLVVYGHCVRNSDPRQQLIDVLRRYGLQDQVQVWQRCPRCNGELAPVAKAEILDQLEPKTKLYYAEFQRCRQCGQIYWQGSHYAHIQSFVDEVLAEL
ncbi:MAG: Mut7-C RNAse domain-containing protein [Caldilineaceae bacterium]